MYGIAGGGLVIGGGVLFLNAYPAGLVGGGIALGAGLNCELSNINQALSKEEDYNHKQTLVKTGIGALGAGIAAPFATGGAVLAEGASLVSACLIEGGALALGGGVSGATC